MSLKGNTQTMPMPDLLRFLAMRSSTGTLELTRGNDWKRLYLEKGKIISCGSSDPREFLGHFLIAENKITEEQLNQAMEVQKKTKVMLGKILVMIGAISEEDLLMLLERKSRESVFSMFVWDQANFEFFENQLPAVRLVPLSLEIESVVQEGLRRMEEWNRLRSSYPNSKIRFTKSPQAAPDSAEIQDDFSKKMYGLVDGERNIEDLLMNTHSGVFKVLQTLDDLRTRNLIDVSDGQPVEQPEERTLIPPEQMIGMAKHKMSTGKHEEAINLLTYVQERERKNQDVVDLLARAENAFVQGIYENVISPDAILKLGRSLEELEGESMTSEETFLLTRVNGSWDLRSILTITPLREVDALRMLKRLLDRGIVCV